MKSPNCLRVSTLSRSSYVILKDDIEYKDLETKVDALRNAHLAILK